MATKTPPANPSAADDDRTETSVATDADANAQWGGRFAAGPSAIMDAINVSIDVDRRLAPQDIAGSRAHVAMLAAQGIISSEDAAAIARGLDAVAEELAAGTFPFDRAHEDIHMNIEARLRALIGDAAGRLHTARSRNDQVATDFRLWLRAALEAIDADLAAFQRALASQAEAHADAVMPGFTHLQTAQPITFGHHCLAYVEMAARDRGRLADARRRLNECPLGAAALAGTSFPIDRNQTAEALGFAGPMANSLDAVSARDFALEALSALTIAAVHLSRLAEEIVLWTSPLVGFARLPDSLSTGSSIMPQKRNPDAAELVRAKVGRLAGAFQQLVVVMKALPLAYAKDMQEDKAAVFAAVDDFRLCAAAMTAMVAGLEPDRARMAAAAGTGHATATDLADWLVREAGLAFRDAHHVTGRLVAEADSRSCALHELPLEIMKTVEPAIDARVFAVLSPDASAASRTSFGGAAPTRVREQAARWRRALDEETSP